MKVHPVLRVSSLRNRLQTENEIERAFDCGVDGIFLSTRGLISGDEASLFEALNIAKETHPNSFIGINMHDTLVESALGKLAAALNEQEHEGSPVLFKPDAIWVDNMDDSQSLAEVRRLRDTQIYRRGVRLVGGVAIGSNGQIRWSADQAKRYEHDVNTMVTEVFEAGLNDRAKRLEKLRSIKEVVPCKTLAVLGRLTVNDVLQYREAVDEVMLTNRFEDSPRDGRFSYSFLERLVHLAHEK